MRDKSEIDEGVTNRTRRNVLRLSGVLGASALAGCSDTDSDSGPITPTLIRRTEKGVLTPRDEGSDHSDSAALLEEWTGASLEETTDPQWDLGTATEITASIDSAAEQLRLDATGNGTITVATPADYTGWSHSWVVSGRFTLESLSGAVEHEIRVIDVAGTRKIKVPLVLAEDTEGNSSSDDGEPTYRFTFDITGADDVIDDPDSTTVSITLGETYDFTLTHDGSGSYTASIGPQGGDPIGTVSADGSALDVHHGLEYYFSTTDNTVVTHDRIEYESGTDETQW